MLHVFFFGVHRMQYEVITTGEEITVCRHVGLPDTFRQYYFPGLAIIQYFFPFIIIAVAYLIMACHLWRSTAPGNAENNRDAAILRNKKKVTTKVTHFFVSSGQT